MVFIKLTIISYLFASIVFFMQSFFKVRFLPNFPDILLKIGFIFNTLFVIFRWYLAGYPPFTNMYEALILFAWSIVFVYIAFEFMYKVKFFGPLVSFLALFTIGITAFLDNTINPLMPALQSKWITLHVVSYFVGYGALSICFAISLVYLIVSKKSSSSSDLALSLDTLSYHLVAFAFVFLTLGLTSGSVWANVAWGFYWSWDPKETCALITWLFYVFYLHLRIVMGWKEKKAAYLAIAGFLLILFTFVGVKFIFPGLHTYS